MAKQVNYRTKTLDKLRAVAQPAVGEPVAAPAQTNGQIFPGSDYFTWESTENEFRFDTCFETVKKFAERFPSQFWTALKKRKGKMRITVSVEWTPQ